MDDHFETQLEAAREQLAHRREEQDRLDVPRPIEHFAYFSRRARAVQAAAALEEAGYRTALARWRVFGATLEATRLSRLDEETVEAFMHEVHEIVGSHGGDYDGWGGEVVVESADSRSPDGD
jgi:hypothetical protein